ncbi:hypothetical protein CFC21_108785 [Triticum aestivum]|uniref:DUF241 domain-containing protein n=3 Tax=Triticinae TaxID=1648030 RepID=A0A453TAY7_AEGTS|nr:uncharacterized protein LOC109746899 [Aegilops tauschii subsp. strangulata]XP_044444890.1 uncharacterized protein LOC123171468 [Triticum aestivum]KAF7108288.1 hypothetical protein CFC21_108785 [Triticum aestivum]
MAPNFGRSISFPLTPARSFSKSSRHLRSISLPGTTSSHPLLASLNAHIVTIRAWIQDTAAAGSSLPAGLANIHALHAALADLLLLPESRAALQCTTSKAADSLLDAFLLLADAHQGFQECLISLSHAAAESRAALRRGEATRLASAARSQRRAEKVLARLAASISAVSSKCARLNLVGEDAEMAGAIMQAAAASAAASAAVFSAAASMSYSASCCKKMAIFVPVFATRKAAAPETAEAAMERLHVLERCFDECDGACNRVFRSVVQTRVSLLNVMTPTI